MRIKLTILLLLITCASYGQRFIPQGTPESTVRNYGKYQIDSLLRVLTLKNYNGDSYMLTADTNGKFILRPVPSADSSLFLTVTDAAAAYTPLTRTLTINGTAYDLSANRTWTIPGTDTTSLSNRINLKENTANKSGTISASSTLFPTHNAVIAYVTGQGYLTAEVDGSTTNEIELPTQTGHGGEYLTTNGTSPSWAAVAAPATPTWQATLTAGNSATSDAITSGYLRASAFHVQNPTAKNVITSTATADRANTMPDADGTIALIAQTVTNGVTTSAPSQDAVYDAIAAYTPATPTLAAVTAAGSTTGTSITLNNGATLTLSDAIGGTGVFSPPSSGSNSYTCPNASGTLALTSQLTTGGSIQFSGDGATSSFNIPHGISGTPTKISITPGSQAASAAHWVLSVGATNIVVRFAGPPALGTNNITFYWTATP